MGYRAHRVAAMALLVIGAGAPHAGGSPAATDLALGEPTVVVRGAGLHAPRFAADGAALVVRRTDGSHARVSLAERAILPVAAEPAEPAVAGGAAPRVFAQADRVWVRSASGALRSIGAGDRFFAPVVSPDGARVAVLGLATGVWGYDLAAERLVHRGAGAEPAWSPDGTRVVFERTADDGHAMTASELYLWDAPSARLVRLTTTARIERRPTFSPDGRAIAFDDDAGGILIAPLVAREAR